MEEIRATQLVLLQQNEVAAKRAELLTREVDLRKQKSVHEELMVQQQERHHIALEDLRDKVRRAYGDLDRVQVQRDVASEHARSLEWNVRELKETLDATNTELDRLRADLSNSRGKEAKYRSKVRVVLWL